MSVCQCVCVWVGGVFLCQCVLVGFHCIHNLNTDSCTVMHVLLRANTHTHTYTLTYRHIHTHEHTHTDRTTKRTEIATRAHARTHTRTLGVTDRHTHTHTHCSFAWIVANTSIRIQLLITQSYDIERRLTEGISNLYVYSHTRDIGVWR